MTVKLSQLFLLKVDLFLQLVHLTLQACYLIAEHHAFRILFGVGFSFFGKLCFEIVHFRSRLRLDTPCQRRHFLCHRCRVFLVCGLHSFHFGDKFVLFSHFASDLTSLSALGFFQLRHLVGKLFNLFIRMVDGRAFLVHFVRCILVTRFLRLQQIFRLFKISFELLRKIILRTLFVHFFMQSVPPFLHFLVKRLVHVFKV